MAGPGPETLRAPHFLPNPNSFLLQILTEEAVPQAFQKELNWRQQDGPASKAFAKQSPNDPNSVPTTHVKAGEENWLHKAVV